MNQQGGSGRGGRDYTGAERVLAGRLASDDERPVYPSDYCEKCVLENRDPRYERCFHLHWDTPERGQRRETR